MLLSTGTHVAIGVVSLQLTVCVSPLQLYNVNLRLRLGNPSKMPCRDSLPTVNIPNYIIMGAGQEKEWMGCFLDDLRAFGINADRWTTAAHNEGDWCRTVEQGAERFMAKWIAAEKARA